MNAVIVVNQERPEPQPTFWEKHKKKIKWGLAIAGGTLVGILAYKNKDAIASWLGQIFGQSEKETVARPSAITQTDIVETTTIQHIDVPMYTRNLPTGQKPSALKVEQAAEWGYELAENQTWVREYSYERVA